MTVRVYPFLQVGDMNNNILLNKAYQKQNLRLQNK